MRMHIRNLTLILFVNTSKSASVTRSVCKTVTVFEEMKKIWHKNTVATKHVAKSHDVPYL